MVQTLLYFLNKKGEIKFSMSITNNTNKAVFKRLAKIIEQAGNIKLKLMSQSLSDNPDKMKSLEKVIKNNIKQTVRQIMSLYNKFESTIGKAKKIDFNSNEPAILQAKQILKQATEITLTYVKDIEKIL